MIARRWSKQHRQQVREGLADARAGLDDGVAAGLEGLGDELGHLLLRGAVREARQALRERAVGAEDVVENQRGTARNRAIPVAPASSGARRTQRTCV